MVKSSKTSFIVLIVFSLQYLHQYLHRSLQHHQVFLGQHCEEDGAAGFKDGAHFKIEELDDVFLSHSI